MLTEKQKEDIYRSYKKGIDVLEIQKDFNIDEESFLSIISEMENNKDNEEQNQNVTQEKAPKERPIRKHKTNKSTVIPITFFVLGLILCILIICFKSISSSGIFYQSVFYFFLIASVGLFVLFICAFLNAQKFYSNILTSDDYATLFNKQKGGLKAAWKAYEKTLIDWKIINNDNTEIIKKKTRTNSDLYFDGEHWISNSFTNIPVDALLRLIPGTLIGMGILGTFIGFADGVGGLGDVSKLSSEELMNRIDVLTSGLNTAFNTSIIGVIMSVVVNFLMYNPLKNACDMLCQKICDRIDEEFYISDYDALHKDLDGVSDAIKHQFVENTKDLAIEVKKAVSETVEDNLDKLQNVINDQISQLEKVMEVSETIPNKIEQSFINTKEFIQATLDESREKFVTEFNSGIESISSCIQAINDSQEKLRQSNALFAEQVQNVINRFSATSDDISNHFKETADSFTENFGQAATTATDNFKNLSTAIAENFAKIVDQTNLTFDKIQDFAGFYEEANKVTENLNNILSQMQSYNSQTQSGYDSVLNSLTAITEESNATLKEFKQLDSTLSNTVNTITEKLKVYNDTVANALQNYLGSFAEKSSKFADGLTSPVQSLEMTAVSLSDLSQDLTKSVQEFTTHNEDLIKELKILNSSKK